MGFKWLSQEEALTASTFSENELEARPKIHPPDGPFPKPVGKYRDFRVVVGVQLDVQPNGWLVFAFLKGIERPPALMQRQLAQDPRLACVFMSRGGRPQVGEVALAVTI